MYLSDSNRPGSRQIQLEKIMRYAAALVLTSLVGAAASLYTPSAQAGVYVGIGLPVPVVAPPVAVSAPVAPAYYPYAPAAYVGVGYRGPVWGGYGYGRWGYGPGYRFYGHPGYGYRGWGGYHHR
jgi:hypothetical protein